MGDAKKGAKTTEPRRMLLTGRAGVGKTERCLGIFGQRLAAARQSGLHDHSYFILPSNEHADRIHDRLFRANPGLPGLLDHHVLTIRDFIRIKARDTGRRRLTHFDRSRLAEEILSSDAWSWLGPSRATRGLPYLLADFLREVKRSGFSTQEFASAAERLAAADPYFAHKRGDLIRLVERYDALCAERGLVDPEEETLAFASSGEKRGALDVVIFDGFFSFTESQLRFVEAVSAAAARTVVTLTCDASPRRAVFDYPLRMRERLLKAGFEECRVEAPEPPRFASRDLRRLEAFLFSPEPPPPAAAPADVRLLEASGERQQIEMAAREIVEFVRGGGRFWSDVMVVLRSIGPSRRLVEEVFGELGVPCDVHERRRLTENARIRFLVSWMELFPAAQAGPGPALDPAKAAAYARGDYLALAPDVADSVEAALVPAPEPQDTLAALLRLEGEPGRFAARLAEAAREYAALRAPAEARAFYEKLLSDGASPGDGERDADDGAAAKAFFELVDDAMTRGGAFEPWSFNARLRSAAEAGLYSVPSPGKNRVQVYDVSLAQQKEYKCVLVLGLSQGGFPRTERENPLLRDSERAFFNAAGAAFDTRARRAAGERYLFYMAATRARERLVLSRVRQDDEGRAVEPSPFLAEAEACFGAPLPVERLRSSEIVPPPDAAVSPVECVRRFCLDFSYGRDTSELGAEMRRSESMRAFTGASDPAAALTSGLYRREPAPVLRDAAVRAALAEAGTFSATRLKPASACLYKHFAAYVLRLGQSGPPTVRMQNGTIVHRVLEAAYRKLFAGLKRAPSAEEIAAALAAEFDAVFDDPSNAVPHERPFWTALRRAELRSTLERYAREEAGHLAAYPGYLPAHFEWSFGERAGTGPLAIDCAGETLLVEGKIDRIDVNPDTGKALAIDYKTGRLPSHKALKEARDLQGALYVLAARSLLGLDMAGVEYVSVMTGERKRLVRSDCGAVRTPKNEGWQSPADFEAALELAKRTAVEIARRVRSADIPAVPSDPKECEICGYDALCRVAVRRAG